MKYPVKIWLLTILVAPIVLLLALMLYNNGQLGDKTSVLAFIFFTILFGTLFSIPSLILFWYLFDELNTKRLKMESKKLWLCAVGIFLIWSTFLLINRDMIRSGDFNDYAWPAVYSFVLVTFTLTVKTAGNR